MESVSCLISCNLMLLMNFTSIETGKVLMAPPPAHISFTYQTGRLSSNVNFTLYNSRGNKLSPLQDRRLRKTLSCETDVSLSLISLTEKSWWSAPPSILWRFSWTPSGLSETAPRTTEAAAATSAAYLTASWTPAAAWWVILFPLWRQCQADTIMSCTSALQLQHICWMKAWNSCLCSHTTKTLWGENSCGFSYRWFGFAAWQPP